MNKKNLFYVFAIMVVAMLSVGFASCSSDDDNNSDDSTNSKRIAKITYSDGTDIETTIFDYDSHGRVVKKVETMTYSNQEESATTTYTYGDNTIISKTQGDRNNGESHTYTLINDRIVKDTENSRGSNSYTYNYAYDDNGYVKSQVFADDTDVSGKIQFTWENGNLTRLSKIWDDGDSYVITISYSNIPWPKNWIHYLKGTNMDEVLEPLGVWGKMPKNLPAKVIWSEDGNSGGWTIDYTVENGEITKEVFQDINDSDDTEIYTIEWE